jgi:non-specific serine/threonine protein kinase
VATSPSHPLHLLSRLQIVTIAIEMGDLDRASVTLGELSAETRASRSWFWTGRLLFSRALLAERQGDYASADQLLEETICALRAIDDQPGLLQALTLRGAIAADHADRQRATASLTEAVELAAVHGSKLRLAHLLEAVASLVLDHHAEMCVRLAVAAERLRNSLGGAPMPTEQARLGRCLELAKRRLGDRVYARLWRDESTASLEAILADARRALQRVMTVAPHASAVARGESLSDREREVAVLVTGGFSNREIARELVISLKTVEAHVHHVLNKLGLTNRVQIATWGLRHGVAPAERDAAAG